MKYMGSKSKVANQLVAVIQPYIDKFRPWAYIEPFCGGCNVIDKIVASKRIAHDKQPYLIALLKNLDRIDELPEFIEREHYEDVRRAYNDNTGEYEDWYIGAIGFLSSYNGRFFDGGYAGKIVTREGNERNYYQEALRNLHKQKPHLEGVQFVCSDYSLLNTQRAVIYCDPPYEDTKNYMADRRFDYEKFWNWVRKASTENIVLVSSNNAPEDFRCIWEQKVCRTMKSSGAVKEDVEKLYICKEQEEIWRS